MLPPYPPKKNNLALMLLVGECCILQ